MPKGIPNKRYTSEFKLLVVEDMINSNLDYQETITKYNIRSRTQLKRWERIYLEEGSDGLFIERRGRKIGSNRGRPPKLDKKVEEDLIEEVQRLRAEVAYLKKLNALVRERELLEKKRKQSGN
jgi:transposase